MLFTSLLKKYLRLPNFVQNVSFVFFTQAIVFCAGGLSNIILARWLGPEGKGIVYLTILVPWILFTFTSLGITISNIYFTGKKKYSSSEIVSNSLFIALLLTVVVGFIYFALLPFLSESLLRNVDVRFLKLTFFIFPIILITAYLSGVPQGLQRIKEVFSIDILKTLIKLGFLLLLVVFLKMRIGGAIAAIIISFVAGLLLAIFLVLRITPIGIQTNFKIIKALVGFGLKSQSGTVVQFLNYRFDMFLVNLFLTPASVGIYSISVLIAELIWYIPSAFSQVLFPKIADSDIKTANRFTPQVCRSTLFITVCLAGVLFFISKPLILFFFGKRFLPSLVPLQILLPGIVAFSVAKVISSDLVGRGKPLYVTYAAIVSFIVTIILDLLLIPRLGVPGAALASSTSYTISAITLSIIYSRISGNRFLSFLYIRKDDFIRYRDLIRGMF